MPITKRTPIGDVVSDFEKSKAPQFKGKSKAKRRKMAIAAALSKRDGKKMTKKELKKLVKEVFYEATYNIKPGTKIPPDVDFKPGDIINIGETASTSKYDNDPSLKGKQTKLPDALQAGIIKVAKEKGVKVDESELEEGRLKKILTGAALVAALLANKISTDSSPVLKDLKAEYEQAEAKGETEKMKELEDKISKHRLAIDTGVIDTSIQEIGEDLDIGHQDNEPGMLVSDLYRIAKYATELGQMVAELGKLEGEVDFPHWWQAKIIKAKDCLVGAKHYLDGELKTGQAFDND